MIVIRVELWPKGDESRKRTIGTAVIANDGTGTRDVGNYDAYFGRFREHDPIRLLKVKSASWRRARVEGFPRLRHGSWDLIGRALVAACGRRLDVRVDPPLASYRSPEASR